MYGQWGSFVRFEYFRQEVSFLFIPLENQKSYSCEYIKQYVPP